MTNDEVNKIIAEFMRLNVQPDQNGILCEWVECCSFGYPLKYTKSLDALVPVWEKLRMDEFTHWYDGNTVMGSIITQESGWIRGCGKTIQEAAAHATAKAILELKEGKNE